MIDRYGSRAMDFIIVQSQTAVTVYFLIKQLLLFTVAGQLFPRLWVFIPSYREDYWGDTIKQITHQGSMATCIQVDGCILSKGTASLQTCDVGSTLACCWASVVDGGPTANQRWPNVSFLLGWAIDAAGLCVLVHTIFADHFHDLSSTSSSQRGSVWSWMTLRSKGQPHTTMQLTLWPLDRAVI